MEKARLSIDKKRITKEYRLMDFEMRGWTDSETKENYWDFSVKNKRLQVIDHSLAEEQRAVIAAFTQRGSVPQMPGFGNQWAELLTGSIMPQELNAQVRSSIINANGGASFAPVYSMKDGKLNVEIKAVR